MRLRSLEAVRYGALSGQRFAFPDGAFVVLGRNEAGKSTFHEALGTVLFGFDPASKDKHPRSAFGGRLEELELRAEVVLDDGTPLALERSLLSKPNLRLGTSLADLGPRSPSNAPLAAIQATPRALYRSVYSLGAGEALEIGDRVREHVDELLLGETGLEHARPLHKVRAELLADQQALWRADKRGKPRARDLEARLRDARKRLGEVRRQAGELVGKREELARLELDLPERRVRLRRAEARRGLRTLEHRRQELEADLAILPRPVTEPLQGEAPQDPVPLAREVHAKERELREPRTRLEREPVRLSLDQRQLVHEQAQVRRLLGLEAEHEHQAQEFRRLAGELRTRGEELERALGGLGLSLDPAQLRRLPLERLSALAADWQERRDAAEEAGPGARPLWWLPVGGLGLVVVLAAGLGLVPSWAGPLGGVLLAAVLLAVWRRPARADLDNGRPEELAALLDPLGVPTSTLERPAPVMALLQRLEELRRRDGERARLSQELRVLEDRMRHDLDDLRLELERRRLPIRPEDDAPALLERLSTALDTAVREDERRKEDEAERQVAQRTVELRQPELEATRTRLERNLAFLRATLPDVADPAKAWELWREADNERTRLRHDLDHVRRELERSQAEHGELLGGADDGADLDDDARAALELEVQADQERVGELRAELRADASADPAHAQEELAALEEELEGVLRERDRLALLHAVLVEAERRHRERHQPDVLRRAGEYLRTVTDGRYTHLDYPEGPEGGLHVQSTELGRLVSVGDPLSRGTQEQIYLCLRLGTLDYLDQGRETLPLVLDEALVHWDAGRRASLYTLLRQVAERRQVVLFTCHAALADEAVEQLGAGRVALPEAALQPPSTGTTAS